MIRCSKTRDASSVSLDDLLKRLKRCEFMLGIGSSEDAPPVSRDQAPMSEGARRAAATANTITEINQKNREFWKGQL